MFNASWDFPGVDQKWQFPFFKPTTRVLHSPEDDQSILIETLRCQPPILFRTTTTQKRFSHGAITKQISPNHAYFVFIQRETREDLDDDGHQEQEPWPWRHRPHPHQTSALRGWNQRLAWGELRSPPPKTNSLPLSLTLVSSTTLLMQTSKFNYFSCLSVCCTQSTKDSFIFRPGSKFFCHMLKSSL